MATSPGAFRFLARPMQLMNIETPHQSRNNSLEAFSFARLLALHLLQVSLVYIQTLMIQDDQRGFAGIDTADLQHANLYGLK